MLRHQLITAPLAGAGLAKPDLGREATLDALQKLVTQPDLDRFDGAFTNALAERPIVEAFLLVVKAKSQKAKDLVDRLIELPKWQTSESAKILRAALGTEQVGDSL